MLVLHWLVVVVFNNLVAHAWGESHSSGRLLANAMKHDAEIEAVDRLLVTGKNLIALQIL